jgi:hypothetical protein
MSGLWRSRPAPIAATGALLLAGLVPLPGGRPAALRETLRSTELNRVDREANAGGYYEALIRGGDGDEGDRGELALRMLGKPSRWANFHDIEATRYADDDPLLFDLRPNMRAVVFGRPFSTNRHGLRDREYARAKPEGTFRIALLGSSIDMGWGAGDDATYENRLEDWLNAHAARRGVARRFEVLNFAVAAYSPLQRLEVFRRKAAGFGPDLVLYSATMLDPRLVELHICKLLRNRVEPADGWLRRTLADAGLRASGASLDERGELRDKDLVKGRLRPHLWEIADAALGALAAECRARGVPLACVVVPRASRADAPAARAVPLARQRAVAARHAVPVLDVSGALDGHDLSAVELAAWDDHPNERGHELIFLALARAIVADGDLYRLLFDRAAAGGGPDG